MDETTLAMVRQSAQHFAARFRTELGALELQSTKDSIHALMSEAEQLGWMVALDGSPAATPTDTEAGLLAAIAYELGKASPSWVMRWLAHHVARALVNALASSSTEAFRQLEASNRPRCYGLDASCTDQRFAPSLRVEVDAGRQRLNGTLRFVMSGDCATHWVAVADSVDHRRGIVVVDASCGAPCTHVRTLGLNGLGVVEANLDSIDSSAFEWHLPDSGIDGPMTRSLRSASLAYSELIRALIEQAKQIAVSHAQGRRQNGGLLQEIPAVQRMLESIDGALALANITVHAGASGHDITATLPALHNAAQVASDASLQVLGGSGYVVGAGAERLWRDVRQSGQLFFPTH